MSESFERALRFIAECSEEEQLALKRHLHSSLLHPLEIEWGIDADTILGAIRRSSDLTKRGVRGIIAEAVFENSVIPSLQGSAWTAGMAPNDSTYDVILHKGSTSVRIQIKLQRREKQRPKLYYPRHYAEGSLYVVEVQKTRTGQSTIKVPLQGTDARLETISTATEKTRPYRFQDFDILAVNMHPSTDDWKSFRYTVASWLLRKPGRADEIDTLQPVASIPNDVWTDDLRTCLAWFEAGESRSVLTDLLHVRVPKAPRKAPRQESNR